MSHVTRVKLLAAGAVDMSHGAKKKWQKK